MSKFEKLHNRGLLYANFKGLEPFIVRIVNTITMIFVYFSVFAHL